MGLACWRPFNDSVSKQWRRAKPLIDVQGKRVCNRIGRKQGYTQGLIGSICMHDNTYHFFYTEIDSDNKTYLFHRTCRNIATLENTWSPATRVSNEALMEGTVIRVAKAPRMNKWVVLYNGYTDRQRNNHLRQGLMLQVTYDMTVIGKGGLSSLKFFPRSFSGLGISDQHDLGLARGNGVFAQHDFMTDEYGNLAAPCDDGAAGSRGLRHLDGHDRRRLWFQGLLGGVRSAGKRRRPMKRGVYSRAGAPGSLLPVPRSIRGE